MEVVFGSILFDADYKIADDFFKSLQNQSRDDFSILLINDNFNKELLEEILNDYPSLKKRTEIIDTSGKLTRYENRQKLILEAKKKGFDLLVRGDFDDTFSVNRVDSYIKEFDENYGFFYNDITIHGKSIFDSFPKECKDYKDIGQYNYVGEGACAINLNSLDYDLIDSLNEGKTIVFDWYLFTRFLLAGLKGKFVENADTYYRIYESNNIGTPELNEKTINREIEVKKLHYSLLQNRKEYFKDLLEKYNDPSKIKINKLDKYYWWQFTKVEE